MHNIPRKFHVDMGNVYDAIKLQKPEWDEDRLLHYTVICFKALQIDDLKQRLLEAVAEQVNTMMEDVE